jgi:hypothetical protein
MSERGSEAAKALGELKKNYKVAAAVDVSGYSGGISHRIAQELIRMGWQKIPNSNREIRDLQHAFREERFITFGCGRTAE